MLQCRERYSYHVDVASVVRTLLLATRDACAFGTMADFLDERGLALTAEPRWTFPDRPWAGARGLPFVELRMGLFVRAFCTAPETPTIQPVLEALRKRGFHYN